MLFTIYIITEIIIVALGILLYTGIGNSWIVGYNTSTKKEKEHIDKKILGIYTGI